MYLDTNKFLNYNFLNTKYSIESVYASSFIIILNCEGFF